MYVLQLLLFFAFLSTVRCATTSRRFGATHYALQQHPRYYIRSLFRVSETTLSTTTRDGLTFDNCVRDEDCVGDRICFRFQDDIARLCTGESDCVCRPRNNKLVPCTESSVCDTGEQCASRGNKTFPWCLSSNFVRSAGLTSVERPPGSGLTRDLCSDTSDCQGDRMCKFARDLQQDCEERDHCFCWPETVASCCEGEPCIDGEVCAENTNFDDPTPFCVTPLSLTRESNWALSNCPTPSPPPKPSPNSSPNATPSTPANPSPGVPPQQGVPGPPREPPSITFVPEPTPIICISAHQLGHLRESELVFRKHPWGKVLCDSQTSCASPGHIVVYKNKPMMMSSYCEIVGCVERVMQVNSPRYRRKQRIPSMTDGLEFTAFSARYETSLEQYIMALAVKMGL